MKKSEKNGRSLYRCIWKLPEKKKSKNWHLFCSNDYRTYVFIMRHHHHHHPQRQQKQLYLYNPSWSIRVRHLLDDFQSFGGSTYDFRCLIRLLLCLHVITLTSRDTGVEFLVTSQAPLFFFKRPAAANLKQYVEFPEFQAIYTSTLHGGFSYPKKKKHTTTTIRGKFQSLPTQ